MASITALFVVLTLTGQPVANALCAMWCESPSETMNCDEAIAQTIAPEFTVMSTRCATAPEAPPFVTEEGVVRHLVAVVSATGIVIVPGDAAGFPRPHGHDETIVGRHTPLLVLRV
jgi:hypothetical protein